MKRIFFFSAAVFTICSAFTFVVSSTWKSSDKDYTIEFKGGKVEGIFRGLNSTVVLDAAHPENSKINTTVDVSTINTGNGMMNKHALSERALNGKQFKTITFESSSVTKKDDKYNATGKLTMKGVTKSITIPFGFSENGSQGKLSGSFTVDPSEYGIKRAGTPDKVTITLNIGFNK